MFVLFEPEVFQGKGAILVSWCQHAASILLLCTLLPEQV